jgi:hypothetical protein
LDKAKRFKSYAHPEAPFLSAKAVWDHLLPALNSEVIALQEVKEIDPQVFSHFAKLYQLQSRLQPEVLRRILIYQHQQYPWLTIDQKLSYEDLALFGFHTAVDWFGHNFVDLVSQFILNAAVVAEEKGYQVSLEEAKGDLIHHFQEAMKRLAEAKINPDTSFHSHLRMLGFDERSAAESWRKVLLFRRYFRDVGDASFVDRLPYRDFAEFARETAVVQKYEWPIRIKDGQDLAALQFYIKTVSAKKKGNLPVAFLPVEEVEKKAPDLVQTTYSAQVAQVSVAQVGLRAPLKEVLDWEEANWARLKKEFSLPDAATREERFKILERINPKMRAQIDALARVALVSSHPEWVQEALAVAPLTEKTWAMAGSAEPTLSEEGKFFRIENIKTVKEKHILSFDQAREVLNKLVKAEGEYSKEKNPLVFAAKEAIAALQKNREDGEWLQTGSDLLLDQFKLRRKEQAIQRTSKEEWMKEEAFLMLPDLWSPIHVSDDGEIAFFYLQEKRKAPEPILEQLNFGKETLAADAQKFVAERLIKNFKKKNAIVIPAQKEE